MKFISFVLLSVLLGCATAKKIMAPSGNEGYLIQDCSSAEACYEKAAEVCPKGYKLHNNSNDVDSINGQVYTSTTLLIECKK
ncbi:MAG: hypothetical protein JNM93_01690 [Bacteriovoracaceae bacterium]|nr:hypothetical protein [Bacteriovoracaceae bacterium]